MPREILITDIVVGSTLPHALYSEQGELLLSRGKRFSPERLAAFLEGGFSRVYAPAVEEDDASCGDFLRCQLKDILEVAPDEELAQPVSDEAGRVLLQQGMTISPQTRDTLLRKGIHQVIVRRRVNAGSSNRTTQKLRSRLSEIAQTERMSGFGRVFVAGSVAPERMLVLDVADEALVGRIEAQENDRSIKLDKTTRNLVEAARLNIEDNRDDATRIVALRSRFIKSIQELFAHLLAGERVDSRVVEDIAKTVVSNLVSDPYHRLYLGSDPEGTDYLASHSLNTLILSVNIAARLDYAVPEIVELCYGALLHDVGMLRIPAAIRQKGGSLSEIERRAVERHPSLGLDFLPQLKRVPASAMLVIIQENERLDGSGYPRQLKARRLHPFTRIVQLAAAYDAMTHRRPFAEAQHPYFAMAELLKQTHDGKFDGVAMRALLETLSLFPIGSGVRLADGRVGYTLDASGREFTRPVVLIDRDQSGRALSSTQVLDLQDMANAEARIIEAVAPCVRKVEIDVTAIESFAL